MVITFAIEYNAGIICACLPCLRPLLVAIFPRHFASSSASQHQHQVPTIGSAREKHLNAPFRSFPSDSIMLGDNDMYLFADTFELDDVKDSDLKVSGRSWVEIGRQDGNAAYPENGIYIKRNVSIQEHSRTPVIKVTGDAGSEEWIMKEDHVLP
jgi:hypothetical protein